MSAAIIIVEHISGTKFPFFTQLLILNIHIRKFKAQKAWLKCSR